MKSTHISPENTASVWCQQFGLRPTKTRELLFTALQDKGIPQSVPELLVAFGKKKYVPHKTTLYREIERLVSQGALTKVQLSETRISYELTSGHHHHFVCRICKQITEITFCEQMMKLVGTALQNQGKQVTHHTFEFFGVCEFCT